MKGGPRKTGTPTDAANVTRKPRPRRRRSTARRVEVSAARWERVPARVRDAYERGWWLLPRTFDARGDSWHTPFAWKKFQDRRPTRAEIVRWNERHPNAQWLVLPHVSGFLALDFDSPEGDAALRRLKLEPHIFTPGGGAHIYIEAPEEPVQGGARVDPARFPGMDLLALGQTATFYGRRGKGRYRRNPKAPRDPYPLSALPADMQGLITSRTFSRQQMQPVELPADWTDDERASVRELLGDALRREDAGRNETSLWLACQLRDERYPFDEVVAVVCEQYQPLVERAKPGTAPYSRGEAYASVVSAFSRPARLPRSRREEDGIVMLSDVVARPVSWLWGERIPLRKVTILEGDPDLGKTTLTLEIAARVSAGEPLPGDTEGIAGSVLIASAEDDPADTIVPRLAAAGADLSRIGDVTLRKDEAGRVLPLELPDDLVQLERGLREVQRRSGVAPRLVIIDPILGFLSESIHYGNDPQVRRAMFPLKQFAEEQGVAVLLVRHLSKDTSQKAIARGGGSMAFTAAARSVMVAGRHPDDPATYVLARVKSNLAKPVPALAYAIEEHVQLGVPRIVWRGAVAFDADTLLNSGDARRDAPARREAEAFLRELLSEGPVPQRDVEAGAKGAGLSMATVRKAKQSLGVKSERVPGEDGRTREWRWSLPVYTTGNVIHFDFTGMGE